MTLHKDEFPSTETSYNWDKKLGIRASASSSIIRWVDGSIVLFSVINNDTFRGEHEEQQKQHQQELREAAPAAQVESGTTRKYGGMGLRLTTTKNIVEMMGGKLSVERQCLLKYLTPADRKIVQKTGKV